MPKGQQIAYLKITKKISLLQKKKQYTFKKIEIKTEIITSSRFSHNNPIIS